MVFTQLKWRLWWCRLRLLKRLRRARQLPARYNAIGIISMIGAAVAVLLCLVIIALFWRGGTEYKADAEPVTSVQAARAGAGPVTAFYWQRLYELDTYGQILASPLLLDLNAQQGADILIANALGAVYAFTGATGTLFYELAIGERAVASPLPINVLTRAAEADSAQTLLEPFIVTETGQFYALAVTAGRAEGDYLYRSRAAEQLTLEVFGKPAYGKVTTLQGARHLLFMADAAGVVAAYESLYGRSFWTNATSFRNPEGIFAPLVLFLPQHLTAEGTAAAAAGMVVAAGTRGRIVALTAITGAPLWTLQVTNEVARLYGFEDGVRSAMTAGDFIPAALGLELALVTERGKGAVIAVQGGLQHCSFNLKGTFVSALTKGVFYAAASPVQLLAISVNGDFYTISMQERTGTAADAETDIACVVKTLTRQPKANFIASPVVADFNLDGISDVLIVSRQGELFLLDGRTGVELLPPLALGYAVTATPAVAELTGDGSLEVVLAGENGTVTVLSLFSTPQHVFMPYSKLSTMFLRDTYNHN